MELTDALIVHLALGALATWRIASFLFAEDGPYDIFKRLRTAAGVYNEERPMLGTLLSCFWCTSVWAAILVVYVLQPAPGDFGASAVWVLALSALAIVIEEKVVHLGV